VIITSFLCVAMSLSSVRRALYLDLFSIVCQRGVLRQHRCISTRSAINRGLEATRDSSNEHRGGRDGPPNRKRGTFASSRTAHVRLPLSQNSYNGRHDPASPQWPAKRNAWRETRASESANEKGRQDESATGQKTDWASARLWENAKKVRERVLDLQQSEAGPKTKKLKRELAAAATKVNNTMRKVNVWLNNLERQNNGNDEQRRSVSSFLSGAGACVKDGGTGTLPDVAEKSVIVERPQRFFEMVQQGEPLNRDRQPPSPIPAALQRASDSPVPTAEPASRLRLDILNLRAALDKLIDLKAFKSWKRQAAKRKRITANIGHILLRLNMFELCQSPSHEHILQLDGILAILNESGIEYRIRSKGTSLVIESPQRPETHMKFQPPAREPKKSDESQRPASDPKKSDESPSSSAAVVGDEVTEPTKGTPVLPPPTSPAKEEEEGFADAPAYLHMPRSAGYAAATTGAAEPATPDLVVKGDVVERSSPSTPAQQVSSPDEDGLDDEDYPVSVPYTTAASVFLYGSNVVLAALRARSRKLYYLYVHSRAFTREESAREIMALARKAGISIEENADVRLLDKMSEGRPHNGVALESSTLPSPPVLALLKHDNRTSIMPLTLARQSAEDIVVNGAPTAVSTNTNSWRHPFVVLLDGITDPGNLGNILRSAHFYGVDAVAVATNTCANLASATLAKASSGACEAVRLFALPQPANFVFDSAKAGWKVYAAVAPAIPGKASARDVGRSVTTTALSASSPLAQHPCILMLGSEGEGLRANLTTKADRLLSIEHGGRMEDVPDVGVDSLNVGVAAGVLMEAFLRNPTPVPDKASNVRKSKTSKDSAAADRANERIASEGGDLGFWDEEMEGVLKP